MEGVCAERVGWHWQGEECHACGKLTEENDRGVNRVAVECDNSIHLRAAVFSNNIDIDMLVQKRAQVSVTLQVDEPGECDSIRRNTLQLALP